MRCRICARRLRPSSSRPRRHRCKASSGCARVTACRSCARGHGTGLSGGALPVAGGVVIALSRLNRVLDVDIPNQRVTVEPGVTNLEITRQVAPFGFYYAPDPSSQQVCSIGGNVAENSGGAHCLKYGFTVHHVLGVEAVLPDGEIVHIGSTFADTPGPDLLGLLVGSEGTLAIVDAASRCGFCGGRKRCRRCSRRSTRSTPAAPRCRTSSAPASFRRRSK